MTRLDEIIADVTANGMREWTDERVKQVADEYARECAKASLEKASEAALSEDNYFALEEFNVLSERYVKASIRNPDNITLL